MKTKGLAILIGIFLIQFISSCCKNVKYYDFSEMTYEVSNTIIEQDDILSIELLAIDLEFVASNLNKFAFSNVIAFDCDDGWGGMKHPIERIEIRSNTDFNDAKARDFDFSEDYRVWVELAQTYIERAKTHRSQQAEAAKQADFTKAREALYTALKFDVENHQAYYNLYVIAKLTQDHESAEKYRNLHEKYRPDNNAKDTAISAHRVKNPAADHAAAPVVIYDLNRPTIYTEQITTLKPLEEK